MGFARFRRQVMRGVRRLRIVYFPVAQWPAIFAFRQKAFGLSPRLHLGEAPPTPEPIFRNMAAVFLGAFGSNFPPF